MTSAIRFIRRDRGQSMIEFAVVLPLLLIVVLGLVEVSYALYDQHVVTKLTREGSNLISRDTSLQDAASALGHLSSRPVDFSSNSKVIFSVIMNVGATGASNYGQPILYQRYEYGAIGGTSRLLDRRRFVHWRARLHGDQSQRGCGPSRHQSAGQRLRPHRRHGVRDGNLHCAHPHHAVQPLWRDGAQHALFDRVFLATHHTRVVGLHSKRLRI